MPFLTRREATHQYGVMEARTHSDRAASQGLKLAVRIGGIVYEARPDEVLHAQVTLRALADGAQGAIEDGWST